MLKSVSDRPNTKEKKTHDVNTPPQETGTEPQSKEVRVSEDEKYISKLNNIWLHTDTDYLGEVADTGNVADAGEIQYYHPPAKWEGGYKGPTHAAIPLGG